MYHKFRNVTTALRDLCDLVMNDGYVVESRAGKTRELTHVHVELTNPWEREILLPGRGHSLPAQIAETMWILAGRNDVEFLAHYLPRSPQFSDDGKVWRAGYGPRLRNYGAERSSNGVGVDQMNSVVELLKKDRTTRRAVMSIWDPFVDTEPGLDIPCNNWLHFMARKDKLDLHVAIRSNDLIWGWSGINAFEWSVLLEVVAALTDMEMGSLHFSISSLHIYDRHWEKATQLAATPTPAGYAPRPRLKVRSTMQLDSFIAHWFDAEEALRTGTGFDVPSLKDPLLRDWAHIIGQHWTNKREVDPFEIPEADPFVEAVTALHNQKHEAYGDSWMKRGELFSIIPNIARKVDRLASGKDTDDETQADTAIDLLVYLAKYRVWLTENGAPKTASMTGGYADPGISGNPRFANELIASLDEKYRETATPALVKYLGTHFETLLHQVEQRRPNRYVRVDTMLELANALARRYAK